MLNEIEKYIDKKKMITKDIFHKLNSNPYNHDRISPGHPNDMEEPHSLILTKYFFLRNEDTILPEIRSAFQVPKFSPLRL